MKRTIIATTLATALFGCGEQTPPPKVAASEATATATSDLSAKPAAKPGEEKAPQGAASVAAEAGARTALGPAVIPKDVPTSDFDAFFDVSHEINGGANTQEIAQAAKDSGATAQVAATTTVGGARMAKDARGPALAGDPVQIYRLDIEKRLQKGRSRIVVALKSQVLARDTMQKIANDVSWAMQAIRARVESHAADHAISAAEADDVRALAESIAGELGQTYGAIAPWNLLAD